MSPEQLKSCLEIYHKGHKSQNSSGVEDIIFILVLCFAIDFMWF